MNIHCIFVVFFITLIDCTYNVRSSNNLSNCTLLVCVYVWTTRHRVNSTYIRRFSFFLLCVFILQPSHRVVAPIQMRSPPLLYDSCVCVRRQCFICIQNIVNIVKKIFFACFVLVYTTHYTLGSHSISCVAAMFFLLWTKWIAREKQVPFSK